QPGLFDAVNLSRAHYDVANVTIARAAPSTLVCPSDPDAGWGEDLHPMLYRSFRPPGARQMITSYAANAGVMAVLLRPWGPASLPDRAGARHRHDLYPFGRKPGRDHRRHEHHDAVQRARLVDAQGPQHAELPRSQILVELGPLDPYHL